MLNPTISAAGEELLNFAVTGDPSRREDVVHAGYLFAAYADAATMDLFIRRDALEYARRFEVEAGSRRRYLRVQMIDRHGGKEVHCFIDATNGDILERKTWKEPRKGARYNLFDQESLQRMFQRFVWAGSYLI